MENMLKRQKFLSADIFGGNGREQCDIPNDVKNKKIKRIILGGEHSALMFEDGLADIFGDNDWKQCDIPNDVHELIINNHLLNIYNIITINKIFSV